MMMWLRTWRNTYTLPSTSRTGFILDEAIDTKLFDYLFVHFYDPFLAPNYKYNNNDDDENGNNINSRLLEGWKNWTDRVPNSKVFMGLPAYKKSVVTGYVEPTTLKDEILPIIKQTSNYGGILIANRYYDQQYNYSDEIKDSVPINKLCTCTCEEIAMSSHNFYGLLRQF